MAFRVKRTKMPFATVLDLVVAAMFLWDVLVPLYPSKPPLTPPSPPAPPVPPPRPASK